VPELRAPTVEFKIEQGCVPSSLKITSHFIISGPHNDGARVLVSAPSPSGGRGGGVHCSLRPSYCNFAVHGPQADRAAFRTVCKWSSRLCHAWTLDYILRRRINSFSISYRRWYDAIPMHLVHFRVRSSPTLPYPYSSLVLDEAQCRSVSPSETSSF
jgi:hypothetical protein